jgi:DNA polymerase-3 subunit gamma/tau
LFDEILSRGFDGAHFISGLSEHFRNLLVGKDQATLKLLEVSEGIRNKYLQQAQSSSVSFLMSALNIANQCDLNYKLSKNQRLQVELALLKMCNLQSVFNLAVTPLAAMPAQEGQKKKKPDSAAITPEREQKQAAQPPAPAVGAVQPQRPPAPEKPVAAVIKEEVAAEKPKVFIPNSSLASASVKIPSLRDVGKMVEAAAEEEDPYIKGDAKDAFTDDQFSKCWSDYAAKIKSEGKKNALTIFISYPPKKLGDNVYEVVLENKVQENLFREERPNLLNYLRLTLRNFDIEVNARVDEVAVVKRPYTASEKFQYMAQKNPALAELKNKFNLDFD